MTLYTRSGHNSGLVSDWVLWGSFSTAFSRTPFLQNYKKACVSCSFAPRFTDFACTASSFQTPVLVTLAAPGNGIRESWYAIMLRIAFVQVVITPRPCVLLGTTGHSRRCSSSNGWVRRAQRLTRPNKRTRIGEHCELGERTYRLRCVVCCRRPRSKARRCNWAGSKKLRPFPPQPPSLQTNAWPILNLKTWLDPVYI